ncbi:TPA: hypothetical protein KQG29_001546 [Clostridioides difficile]|nr:hypothetical protein [Clostridioides difficile]
MYFKHIKFSNRFFTIVIICISLLITLDIIHTNKKIETVYSKRTTSLDKKERTKLWVIEDIRSFLSIKDTESYLKTKSNSHFTDDLKYKLFGKEYDASKFFGADEVSIQESEYTIDSTEQDEIYCVKAISKRDNKSSVHKYLVFVSNNYIYDIKAI